MLNEQGFYRKTYNDILTDLNLVAKQQFGEDINLEETSTLGKFIRIIAYELDELWQDIEGAYFSGFISTATGVSLDRLSSTLAITRYLEANATVNVTFEGTANYEIPVGFIVATATGVQYTTTSACTLDENGDGTTEVMCLETGSKGNVEPNKITVIVNPDEHVTSVNNTTEATGGREKETDVSFRERMIESIGSTAGSTVDAIQGSVLKLNGVKSVTIIENNSSLEDEESRPPHSFELYVQGGENQAIGDTIFNKKPIGVQAYGETSVTTVDISGNEHTVKFSRPNESNVYVRANLTVNSEFESVNEVQTAIIDYIGGTDTDNTYYYGLNMGEDVIHSKLISIISSIKGVEDVTVTLSTDGSTFAAQNITIASNYIPITDDSKVTVEVVA